MFCAVVTKIRHAHFLFGVESRLEMWKGVVRRKAVRTPLDKVLNLDVSSTSPDLGQVC